MVIWSARCRVSAVIFTHGFSPGSSVVFMSSALMNRCRVQVSFMSTSTAPTSRIRDSREGEDPHGAGASLDRGVGAFKHVVDAQSDPVLPVERQMGQRVLARVLEQFAGAPADPARCGP